ncbi:hypothetical protein OS493_002485 [Desmophyllum pertusum]|uniref:Uncharacterized protein n=1 Tax=Desmophyllum pertusum TaxID=174260 RepID=A0A9W9YVT1_9CNID|nr:hypothetical protein OS493_002485 [Desmophyllum pertusum]
MQPVDIQPPLVPKKNRTSVVTPSSPSPSSPEASSSPSANEIGVLPDNNVPLSLPKPSSPSGTSLMSSTAETREQRDSSRPANLDSIVLDTYDHINSFPFKATLDSISRRMH